MRQRRGGQPAAASLDPETGARSAGGRAGGGHLDCPRVDIPGRRISSAAPASSESRSGRTDARSSGSTSRSAGSGQEMTASLAGRGFRLHERRRTAAGWTSIFDRSQAGLHRRLISSGGPSRGPAMVLAEQDGEPVAVLYGFRWEDVFAYYQTGWQPERADANLATVLVAETIRLAAGRRRDGVRLPQWRGDLQVPLRRHRPRRRDLAGASGLGGLALRAKYETQARMKRAAP